MLEEHGHVDAVGGEADEEEGWDEDGEHDPVNERNSVSRLIRLWGLFDGMVTFTSRMTQLSGTMLADRLASSGTAARGDAISACVTVASDSMIVEEDIILSQKYFAVQIP